MRERGLKSRYEKPLQMKSCRSREGAWIEMFMVAKMLLAINGRSREGAWIEIVVIYPIIVSSTVAPVRERGLKSICTVVVGTLYCRSREGAWIEIRKKLKNTIDK